MIAFRRKGRKWTAGPLLAVAAMVLCRSSASAQTPLPDAPGVLLASAFLDPAPHAASATPQTPTSDGEIPAGQARIAGLVSDIQGGMVPGADVELESLTTHAKRSTKTDSEARFSFPDLPAGAFLVRIQAPGLARFESPTITLKEGEQYELPSIALLVASSQSVDVFFTREEIAQRELKVEEKQRVLGVLPNFYTSYVWDAAPLTAKQKFDLAAHSTFDPVSFVTVAAVAGVQYDRGIYPEFGYGASGYFIRYGSDFGTTLIGHVIGRALLPGVFHQDPRYFYIGPGTPSGKRAWHAISSAWMCRNDRTTRNQFCYSHVLGSLSAGAIANSWHSEHRGAALTFETTAEGIAGSAVTDLVREFVLRVIAAHVPSYGKGKPANEPDEHKQSPDAKAAAAGNG